jgi:hypothetical protein
MTQQASNGSVLRFVDAGCGVEATPLRERNTRDALEVTDARWVFATRVAESLEGHSAAILSPEKRERLLKLAEILGLRAFNANLIIAIVQDSVRCGLEPLSRSTADRLTMVAGVQRASTMTPGWSKAMVVAWGMAFGIMGATLLINWVSG